MSIKEKIGARIKEARKEAGLTMQQLADKIIDMEFKVSRISNWESGLRMPGPNEIILVGNALGISPAYLMCLTDQKMIDASENQYTRLLPCFSDNELQDYLQSGFKEFQTTGYLPIDFNFSKNISEKAFAFKVQDQSMLPELQHGDFIVIDPQKEPLPGQLTLVVMQNKFLIRKIRDKGSEIQFIPSNEDWPIVSAKSLDEVDFIAPIVEVRRQLL